MKNRKKEEELEEKKHNIYDIPYMRDNMFIPFTASEELDGCRG